MPHVFTLHRESLKRKTSAYVVVAHSSNDVYLYVGKTGDNRAGCNPLISRCGNHFSYSKTHSQVRNKIPNHESREYTYVFEHFDDYHPIKANWRVSIDRINEMERWLNREVQELVSKRSNAKLLNPYNARSYVSVPEKEKRASFRTPSAEVRIKALIAAVEAVIDELFPPLTGSQLASPSGARRRYSTPRRQGPDSSPLGEV